MSTPKTPMEVEAKILGIIDDEYGHIRRPGVSAIKRAIAIAYKQGDEDRERLMKEEASRGFDEWWDDYAKTQIVSHRQDGKVAWLAARADRQELVACVLEMEQKLEYYDMRESDGAVASRCLDRFNPLINKLKAEKDAP